MEVRVSPQVDELLQLSQDLEEYEAKVRNNKVAVFDIATSGRTSIEEAMKNKVAEIMQAGVNENDVKALRDIVSKLPDGNQKQAMQVQLKILENKLEEDSKKKAEEGKEENSISFDSNKANDQKNSQDAQEFYQEISKYSEIIKNASVGAFNEFGEAVDYSKANIIQVSKDAASSVIAATKSLTQIWQNLGIEVKTQEYHKEDNSSAIALSYRMPSGFEHIDPTKIEQQELEKMLRSRENAGHEIVKNEQAQTQVKIFGSGSKEQLQDILIEFCSDLNVTKDFGRNISKSDFGEISDALQESTRARELAKAFVSNLSKSDFAEIVSTFSSVKEPVESGLSDISLGNIQQNKSNSNQI